jgi:TolB-like protein
LVDEERIAAMLVNELAKLPALNVRPFRPMTVASSPEATDKQQLRALADELGVGGLVLVEVSGEGPRREVNLQLVDPHNGEVLWGERFAYTDQPSSLLARTDTAAILAEKVGQQVAALKRTGRTENEDAFFCLVRGKARFDPDSEVGMRSAIDCFQHARTLDPAFVDAHAGLALTTLALAGRTTGMESQRLVAQAREAISDAMTLTTEGAAISREPLVNLANAILLWQADHQFVEADPFFQAALQSLPNYWQTHHEYAFYQAALGSVKATDWAQRAVMLNPMSVSVRLDEARLGWFQGDAEGALRKAASILRDNPRQGLAKGLAIDVYEQQEAYGEAAALLGESTDRPWDRARYLAAREASLERLPYGPFGPTLNRAIWEARAGRVDEVRLQQVVDQQPPLLVLLLAAHPALTTARSFAAAQSVLPGSRPAAPG